MDTQIYREEILAHWRNPQNYGELKKATIDVYDLNPLCGDEIRLQLKLQATSDKQPATSKKFRIPNSQLRTEIAEVRFLGNGCAISQAACSILTEFIKGKTLKEVEKITTKDHLKNIGINPTPARLKCALLSFYVLQKALKEIDNRNS